MIISCDDSEIMKRAMAFTIVLTGGSDTVNKFIEHFSSWNSLKRATAWILKFKRMLWMMSQKQKDAHSILHLQSTDPYFSARSKNRKAESKTQFGDKALSVDDLKQAEKALVGFIQQQTFQTEMTSLRKGHTVKKISSIYKLDPFLMDGILRVGGGCTKCQCLKI